MVEDDGFEVRVVWMEEEVGVYVDNWVDGEGEGMCCVVDGLDEWVWVVEVLVGVEEGLVVGGGDVVFMVGVGVNDVGE